VRNRWLWVVLPVVYAGSACTEPRGIEGHYVLATVNDAAPPFRFYSDTLGQYETLVSSSIDLRSDSSATRQLVVEIKTVYTTGAPFPSSEDFTFTIRRDSVLFRRVVDPRPGYDMAFRLVEGRLEDSHFAMTGLGYANTAHMLLLYER
jgi:hypothetical protein